MKCVNKLQYHKGCEEGEYRPSWERFDYYLTEHGDQCGEHPVRSGTPSLTRCAHAVREDFGNEYPNDGTLAYCMGSDERENEEEVEPGRSLSFEPIGDHR